MFVLRWTLDASIIGSNPGEESLRKKKSQVTIQKEKKWTEFGNFFCLGVGLRPSSSDERIDSSMFQLEVTVSFVLPTAPILFWKL